MVRNKDELVIGETRVAVVDYDGETLIIRVDGANQRYHLSQMSMKVALTLAGHALDTKSAVNKVIVGSFLAIDYRGDKQLAKRYFDEASRAGFAKDVEILLPEVGLTAGAPPVQLEVPKTLTPAMRAQLTPANWLARRQRNGKWVRGPITGTGRTINPGYLSLIYDGTQTDPMQVINRKLMTGDFTCRLILDEIKEGQVVGLFSADDEDAAFIVALPAGTVHLEFARKEGKFTCNINGNDVDVQSSANAASTLKGFVGLSLPPGSNCFIAYAEFPR